MEQINVGDAKGWVRYFIEKGLSEEPSSAAEDDWSEELHFIEKGLSEEPSSAAEDDWSEELHFIEKGLSEEPSSAAEDDWLNLSVKITLLSDEGFRNALPSVLRRLPMHRLPKIDTGNEVRHQGTDGFSRTANILIALWQAALDAFIWSIITTA